MMSWKTASLCLLIVLTMTVFAFWPCLENDFVNWDDPAYLQKNYLIKEISLSKVKDILTTYINGVYQPLTIFSFALEYHFFQLNPLIYHGTNVILHVFNTFFVFVFIYLLSQQKTTALIVALLFGIHPMRVESVAWITERKDVLFSFFYFISLNLYCLYRSAQNRKCRFLAAAFIFFVLSVMSKPAGATLPIIFLLVDYYQGRKIGKGSIMEKIPFFIVALAMGGIVFIGTFTPAHIDAYPFSLAWHHALARNFVSPVIPYFWLDQILLTSHTVSTYLLKIIWVTDLSCYYPLISKRHSLLPIEYYFSFLVVIIMLLVILKYFRKNKTVLFGVLFFCVTIFFLLPSGHIGHSLFADRFTYVPYVGIFFLIATSLRQFFVNKEKMRNPALFIVIFVYLGLNMFFISQTRKRCRVWKNSMTLWSDVIEKYPQESLPYFNRGNYFLDNEQVGAAIMDFTKAIVFDANNADAYVNRGIAYLMAKNYKQALADYNAAVVTDPYLLKAYINRSVYFLKMNEYEKALADCHSIFQLSPENKKALEIRSYLREKGL